MKKYFAMATVATMFAACTNEDVTPQVDALTGTPIVVKTNIAKPVNARVAGMDSGNDLNAFILDIQGDTDYYVRMQKNDDGWESLAVDDNYNMTECEMVWANSNDVTVSALCIPNISGKTAYRDYASPVSVFYDQSEAGSFKQSDVLYMSPTVVTPSTAGIEVNFVHLMSKVTVTITGESEATEVKVDGTGTNAHFYPFEKTWDYTYSSSIETITACKDSYTEGTGVSVYEVILVPQEVAADTFAVSFKMGDVTYQWTSAEAVTLESGKHYNIALTVPKDPTNEAVVMKAINVAEWTLVDGILGGNAIQQ